MGDFPCWQFLLRDSLALQHKEKIILSLCVVVSVCMCVCWQVAERKSLTEWTDRISVCVPDSLALCACMCGCVLLPNKDGGSMNVCLAAALRCIHTYPLQFSSYCEQPDISGEIAAVLKLLLLEDLQGKMVCNSHPALPLCCPCC